MKNCPAVCMLILGQYKSLRIKIFILVRVGMVKKNSHATVPLILSCVYTGMTESQVYNIFVAGQNVSVYCDMKTGQQI
jgi:hypothetical protein